MQASATWHRTPYSTCGLASCASCEHFLAGRCPSCVRGNALAQRAHQEVCAIYRCVKAHGAGSCRTCRAPSCPVLESGESVRCGLTDYFAGERGGTPLVAALSDLRSQREEPPPVALPPRLIQRLPAYLAALDNLSKAGVRYVASAELALRIGSSPMLVRKDLSVLGNCGRRSAGYEVEVLSEALRRAAGLAKPRRAAWFGCERLSRYPRLIEDFRRMGCEIAAAFCHDDRHVGQELDGLIVKPMRELAEAAQALGLSVAVVAADDDRAQAVAESAAAAGMRCILNLTDTVLVQPRGAVIENVSPVRGLVSLLLRSPGLQADASSRNRIS